MLNKFLIKTGVLIGFITVYFFGIIPAREASMTQIKSQMNEKIVESFTVFEEGNRGVTVQEKKTQKKYKARVPFGMNFFIGMIGLIIISAKKKYYIIESVAQIIFGVFITLSFLIGVQGYAFLLQISDMLSVYFLPLVSLFMVVLAFIEKKSNMVKDE